MASNAPGQSTQPAYRLGPSLSVDRGAPVFAFGECVLIRLAEEIQVEGYVENEATAAGTELPPISTGSSPQHFAFVRDVRRQQNGSFTLEVYPVLAFTNTGGALPTYNSMSDATKAALLPLPPLSSRLPTPDAFGEPLDFGNWSTYRDSFLHVFPRLLTIPTRRTFKRMVPPLIMPWLVLSRIDSYRQYILSTTSTQTHDDQHHPPPNAGSRDEQGSSNLPHGQTGDGQQAAPGVTSATTSPTIIGDGEGEKTAGAGLDKLTQVPLMVGDVDEDAEDADATTRDELILLARDNPIWIEELRKYLKEEEKENERMQNECMTRLAQWREDIAT